MNVMKHLYECLYAAFDIRLDRVLGTPPITCTAAFRAATENQQENHGIDAAQALHNWHHSAFGPTRSE